jgi:WD40 repeat protein
VAAVAFTPDGKSLATCCLNRPTVRLWDVATGKVRSSLDCRTEGVSDLKVSADGRTLAVGCRDEAMVRLWDLGAEKLAVTLTGHTGRMMTRVAFSPDGKTLASAATVERRERRDAIVNTHYEGEVKLWDVASGKERFTIHGHEERVYCLRFAPDGKTLATGDNEGIAKIWDAGTGKELATFNGHRGPNPTLTDLAFSPDGKILATASLDKTILLWDLSARKVVAVLKGDPTPLSSVVFAPDGKRIVSGHQDGGIRIWDMTP